MRREPGAELTLAPVEFGEGRVIALRSLFEHPPHPNHGQQLPVYICAPIVVWREQGRVGDVVVV